VLGRVNETAKLIMLVDGETTPLSRMCCARQRTDGSRRAAYTRNVQYQSAASLGQSARGRDRKQGFD
jgi:hypothetical protein